jgi:4-aminobutyrate aminotransferase
LKTWVERYPNVCDVRGRGLMLGVEVAETGERDAIIQRAFERGLLCLGAGPKTIRLSPPLIVSEEQAGVAMDVLEGCFGE